MNGAEVLALVTHNAIIESILRFLSLALNVAGVTKNDVDTRIADLEIHIQNQIDDINDMNRQLSAREKTDIRSEFTSVCRTFRFDDDQVYSMGRIRTRLSKELNVEIPETVKIIKRERLQSRVTRR